MSPRRAAALRHTTGDPGKQLREHLVSVTERLVTEHGLAGLTTRQIAKRAGVADGVLYNHFAGKDALVLAALRRRMRDLTSQFVAVRARTGTETIEDNLVAFARAAVVFHTGLLPLVSGLLTEPDLRAQLLAELHPEQAQAGEADEAELPGGPQQAHRLVEDYLRDEQAAGRLASGADPAAGAALLIGACHHLALTASLLDQAPAPDDRALRALVTTLLSGLTAGPE